MMIALACTMKCMTCVCLMARLSRGENRRQRPLCLSRVFSISLSYPATLSVSRAVSLSQSSSLSQACTCCFPPLPPSSLSLAEPCRLLSPVSVVHRLKQDGGVFTAPASTHRHQTAEAPGQRGAASAQQAAASIFLGCRAPSSHRHHRHSRTHMCCLRGESIKPLLLPRRPRPAASLSYQSCNAISSPCSSGTPQF